MPDQKEKPIRVTLSGGRRFEFLGNYYRNRDALSAPPFRGGFWVYASPTLQRERDEALRKKT